MGLMDWVNTQTRAAGTWAANQLGAPDNSAVHSAAPVAPTTNQDESSWGQTIGDFARGVSQEGLGAILDPRGAVDRQDAQRDLAGHFNVVAAGTPGAGDQNTVTPEQFQQIARTYSDIRTDRHNLGFDLAENSSGGAITDEQRAQFREGAMNDVASMLQTNAGRQHLDNIGAQTNADGTQRRTYMGMISDSEFQTQGGVGGGRAGGTGALDPDASHREGYIYYRPGEAVFAGDPNRTARSDVTLMHELNHAYHSNARTLEPDVDNSGNGTSDREDQAMGTHIHSGDCCTENAYRRDRAAIGATGSGMRNDQGIDDVGMPQRSVH